MHHANIVSYGTVQLMCALSLFSRCVVKFTCKLQEFRKLSVIDIEHQWGEYTSLGDASADYREVDSTFFIPHMPITQAAWGSWNVKRCGITMCNDQDRFL